MKIKRRWKVILMMGIMFQAIFGLAVYLNGVNGGEQNTQLWFMFVTYVIGFWTGIVVYAGGLDTEEREDKDNKFKNDVFTYFLGQYDAPSETDAINNTAVHFDITPSYVKYIMREFGHEPAPSVQ